jgi:hypothetical protein
MSGLLIFLVLVILIFYVVSEVVEVNRRIQRERMMETLRHEKSHRLFRERTQVSPGTTGEYLRQQSEPDWERQRRQAQEDEVEWYSRERRRRRAAAEAADRDCQRRQAVEAESWTRSRYSSGGYTGSSGSIWPRSSGFTDLWGDLDSRD